MPGTFATVSITNGLNTAIDVYDEYIADPSHPAPIQYTHLQTIAAGATGQVQCIRQSALLLATITGTVQEFAGQYYHQFPVKEMSGTQLSSGTPPPLAYTVTTADRTGAIGSFLFQRYIQANPAAELTKDFHTALTPDPTRAKTVEQSVNDFFLSTTDFKQCTYDSWINVLNWLDNFTSGWQGDYYLYKKPGSQSDPSPLVARLQILSDASADSAVVTICSTDAQGNLAPSSPPQSATLVMNGDGTMQSADPVKTIPVNLTLVWMNEISSTPPHYTITDAVTGSVAGTDVVSTHSLPVVASVPGSSGNSSSDAENANFWIGLLVGAITLAGAVYGAVKWIRNRRRVAVEDARAREADVAEFAERIRAIQDAEQQELSDPGSGVEARLSASESSVESASQSESSLLEQSKRDSAEQSLEHDMEEVESSSEEYLNEGGELSPEWEDSLSRTRDSAAIAEKGVKSGDYSGMSEFHDAAKELSSLSAEGSAEMARSSQSLESDLEREQSAEDAETESREELGSRESGESRASEFSVSE